MRPACHPNVSKVGPLDILIMSSTTFIKLGLWVWCSSMLKVPPLAAARATAHLEAHPLTP